MILALILAATLHLPIRVIVVPRNLYVYGNIYTDPRSRVDYTVQGSCFYWAPRRRWVKLMTGDRYIRGDLHVRHLRCGHGGGWR